MYHSQEARCLKVWGKISFIIIILGPKMIFAESEIKATVNYFLYLLIYSVEDVYLDVIRFFVLVSSYRITDRFLLAFASKA